MKKMLILLSLLFVSVSYAQMGRPQGETLNFPDYRVPKSRLAPSEVIPKIADKINQIVPLKRVVPVDRTTLPGSSFTPLPKTVTRSAVNRGVVKSNVTRSVVAKVPVNKNINTIKYSNGRAIQYYYCQTQQDYQYNYQSSNQYQPQNYQSYQPQCYWVWDGFRCRCIDFLFGGSY
jgi:hypothetical protein